MLFNVVRGTVAASLMLCFSATLPAQSAGDAASTPSLLREAYALTASKKLDEAEAVYRKIIAASPADGYPGMARFLARTGRTAQLTALLADPGFAALPELVRARTYVSAGKADDATALLKSAEASSGSLYQRAVLLANQLHSRGRVQEAAAVLEEATTSPMIASLDRRDLFNRLLSIGGHESLRRSLPVIVDSMISSSTLSFPVVREVAIEGLVALGLQPDYASYHQHLTDNRNRNAAWRWLYALSNLRKGDSSEASSAIETLTTETMTAREQAIVLEELARLSGADTQRAISIYQHILPLVSDPDRIRLVLGQMLFRANDYAGAVKVLQDADPAQLDDANRQALINVLLTSVGRTGKPADVVLQFDRLTKDLPYQRVRDVADAPFIFIPPDNVEGVRAGIEQKTASTSGSENLFILLMSLENRNGSGLAVTDALGRYVEARPNDIEAIHEYAQSMSQQAWKLIADNPVTSPPLEVMQKMADAAARAQWRLVKARPYTPEPYENLMALYKLYGQEEKAREVPKYLADRPNADAEEVHLAAYVYATGGYPELAVPLYERALKMSPITRYRLNYAAALGRIRRFDDAMAIYRDLIKNGVNDKQYHVHEVHLNALTLAVENGRAAEHLQFLNTLLEDKAVAQRDIFLLEEGKVLLASHMARESLPFFEKLRQEFPEQAGVAADYIAAAMVEMEDVEGAVKVLRAEADRTSNTEEKALLRTNVGMTRKMAGDIDAAVTEWEALARDMPQVRSATRALITAGNTLAEAGRLQHAVRTYQNYLRLNTGDPDGEQQAREALTKLQALDVPAQSLVQSAILETAGVDNAPTTATKAP